MENVLAPWIKSVKIEMVRMDMNVATLAERIGKSREHTSSVINGRMIAPATSGLISDLLNVKNAPYSELRPEMAAWEKAIRIAMLERDWDMGNLAEAIGKSRNYTASVVDGYAISKRAARAISRALGVQEAPYSNW